MRERITQTGESLGSSLVWAVAGYTLLVLAAPLSWVGESLGDLRWQVGLSSFALALVGISLLPRKRLEFACLLGLALFNIFPALRVYIPSTLERFDSGTDFTLVQVRWENEPTSALENMLLSENTDIIVLTGVSKEARESLLRNLSNWQYTMQWPPSDADRGEDLEGNFDEMLSTIVLSQVQLSNAEQISFGQGAVLFEAEIDFPGPKAILRVVNLPPPGPGGLNEHREALLEELESRAWIPRTLLAMDMGASDTSLAYSRIRTLDGMSDARQGIGRQATSVTSIGGLKLWGMSMPREFTFLGSEFQVLQRYSQTLLANDPDRPHFRGSTHNVIKTQLRVVE